MTSPLSSNSSKYGRNHLGNVPFGHSVSGRCESVCFLLNTTLSQFMASTHGLSLTTLLRSSDRKSGRRWRRINPVIPSTACHCNECQFSDGFYAHTLSGGLQCLPWHNLPSSTANFAESDKIWDTIINIKRQQPSNLRRLTPVFFLNVNQKLLSYTATLILELF